MAMARGQHNGEVGTTMAMRARRWRCERDEGVGQGEGSTMARGDEDRQSFQTEIWPSIVELKGLHCPIENCQIEGAQKANFVGVFPVVWGFVARKTLLRRRNPVYPATL
jgi:hypothetical protein